MMLRDFPPTDIADEAGNLESVMQMVKELNRLGAKYNASIELEHSLAKPIEPIDITSQFCTAALLFAVSHAVLDAQYHIDDHKGFKCAEGVVQAYTELFGEMLKECVTELVKEVYGYDLFVEKTHNEILAAELLQELGQQND